MRRIALLTAAAAMLAGGPAYAAPSARHLTGAAVADDTPTARASASADGRWVTYAAQPDASCPEAIPFVSQPSGPQCVFQVFLQDTKSGTVTMVSRSAAGPANADATGPTITSDGRLVLFHTTATNLVPAKSGAKVFPFLLYDRVTKKLARLAPKGIGGTPTYRWARISGDGGAVVFESDTDLENGQLYIGGGRPIYHFDRRRGLLSRVTVQPGNALVGASGSDASLSENGRYVAFETDHRLTVTDTDGNVDVYVRDTVARTTVSVTASIVHNCPVTQPQCAYYSSPDIDAAGRVVSFLGHSYDGPVPAESFGVRDLRTNKATIRTLAELGVVPAGGLTYGRSQVLSDDGKVVYAILQGDLSSGGYHCTVWRWPAHGAQATRVIGGEGAVPTSPGTTYSSLSTNRTGSSVFVSTQAALAPSDTDYRYDVYQVTP